MVRLLALPSAALFVAFVAGCNQQSTPTGYTPITGIEILAPSLLDELQCGTGANDVYRYVAVVWDAVDGGRVGEPLVSNVFDCFAIGLFENLPSLDGGSQQFFLQIFAYDRESLPPSLTCPGGLSPSGGACGAEDAGSVATGPADAQWTTTCTATQQQGIPVLAVCQPLMPVQGAVQPEGGASQQRDE
jgi:hypothetical protein